VVGTYRIQPCKFFVGFLTGASSEQIRDHLTQLEQDRKQIKRSIISICYHCNGITWEEAWGMSSVDRNDIVKYVNEQTEEQNAQITGQRQM